LEVQKALAGELQVFVQRVDGGAEANHRQMDALKHKVAELEASLEKSRSTQVKPTNRHTKP
jgi:hypothetical protein